MGRKKTYMLSGVIVISLGILIALYPLMNYYASDYSRSPHVVLKPGNNFVYGGILPYKEMLVLYNITYLGNGKFSLSFDTYNITQSNLTLNYISSLSKPGKIMGSLKLLSKRKLTLNENDPLIKTLFPSGVVTVSALNRTKTSKLSIREIPFSSDFSPASVGFPFIYTPKLPEPLAKDMKLSYYRGKDRYFARVLTVIGPGFQAPNTSMIDGLPTHVPIGVTPKQLDLPELTPELNWKFIESNYVVVTDIGLLKTSVQPSHQDWIGALKYSFTQYSAPVDYVLILLGIVLLILAGRSSQ